MKFVKFVMTAMVILFCVVMGGELFQSHLQTFSNHYFYIDIENEDRELVSSLVASAAETYNEHVFAMERQDIDAFRSQVRIYADEDTKNLLLLTQNITEGEAKSFFAGTTEVFLLPFEEVVENENVVRYYFTGSKDTVSSIRQYVYSQIATSYIHKETITASDKLIYVLWIVSFGFILLLTWVDIQFSRKSDFLKISMGSSIGGIIWGNILIDAVSNIVIFGGAYLVLKDAIFITYKLNFVCTTFCIFIVLNSLLYVTLMNFDYKEIIYGANINGKILANTYLIQALVIIMLVVSLSCNLVTINENVDGLTPYGTIEQLDGYNTLGITPTGPVSESEEAMGQLEASIFLEAYLQNKVLLSTSCAALDDEPIIALNSVALNMVVSDPDLFHRNTQADFIVYIPDEMYSQMDSYDIEFAAATTASNFFGLEEYSFDVETYSHTEVVYFDLRNVSELSYGADMISDPVIVYCNLSQTEINGLLDSDISIDLGDRWANIIFELEDTASFSEGVRNRIENVLFNSVIDQCSQYKNSLIRTVLLNSVLSVFLLALSIMLISVIVKMEYLVHSKELALKKILGYSIVRRNIVILAMNTFAIFIAFITGTILSEMYDVFDVWTLCIVSLFVFLVDNILLLSHMAVAERKNTAHILKGGSL